MVIYAIKLNNKNIPYIMILYYLWALSSKVPPHFNPRAIRADFNLSKPSDANSSQEKKADKSKCAPVFVRAPPVSF